MIAPDESKRGSLWKWDNMRCWRGILVIIDKCGVVQEIVAVHGGTSLQLSRIALFVSTSQRRISRCRGNVISAFCSRRQPHAHTAQSHINFISRQTAKDGRTDGRMHLAPTAPTTHCNTGLRWQRRRRRRRRREEEERGKMGQSERARALQLTAL